MRTKPTSGLPTSEPTCTRNPLPGEKRSDEAGAKDERGEFLQDERNHGAASAHHDQWRKQIEQSGIERDARRVATESASPSCEVTHAQNAVPVGRT